MGGFRVSLSPIVFCIGMRARYEGGIASKQAGLRDSKSQVKRETRVVGRGWAAIFKYGRSTVSDGGGSRVGGEMAMGVPEGGAIARSRRLSLVPGRLNCGRSLRAAANCPQPLQGQKQTLLIKRQRPKSPQGEET